MIETNLENLKNDLREVVNLFGSEEDLSIRHIFKKAEDRVVNTVIFAGQSFAVCNLLPKNLNQIEEKRYIKRYAKLAVYKTLSKVLKKELPWGALTGIRPTKLAYMQLEETGDFKEFFMDTMKVSKEKTDLIDTILNEQKGIYKKDDTNTDFFVFIPFCPSRCKYCSFISADVKSAEKLVDKYVDTLIYEINQSKKHVKNLRSIYIGGGTPVALSDENLDKVLTALDDISNGVEYTVEAGRPDRITPSNLAILKKHGVTRICINPQTFKDETLERLKRNHTSSDVEEKFELAKSDFIVNMDLIAGLEGESVEDFKFSLDKAISLSPDNITVHTLCVKRGSALAQETSRLSDDDISLMVDYARDKLTKNGYNPYYLYRQKYMRGNLENVGYAKKGKACIYNVNVMEEISSTVACGANAISKRVFNGGERIEREASPKDVKTYLDKIDTILLAKEKLFG